MGNTESTMDLSVPFANCGTIFSVNSWANAALYCKLMQITFNKLVLVVYTIKTRMFEVNWLKVSKHKDVFKEVVSRHKFNKLTSIFHASVIDHEFRHDIVVVAVDPQTTLTML